MTAMNNNQLYVKLLRLDPTIRATIQDVLCELRYRIAFDSQRSEEAVQNECEEIARSGQ